jgi:hypothetical protein
MIHVIEISATDIALNTLNTVIAPMTCLITNGVPPGARESDVIALLLQGEIGP